MEDLPRPSMARAACTKPLSRRNVAAKLVEEFKIGVQDMVMVYMSPNPYHESFEQMVDLRKFDLSKHPTGGLRLYVCDDRVHLASISPSTPAARIHDWRACIRGAWLIKIGDKTIQSIEDVAQVFDIPRLESSPSTTLLFSHPEIRPNLSQGGIPIILSAPFSQLTHDQLNNR
jgi:hypothetical protein